MARKPGDHKGRPYFRQCIGRRLWALQHHDPGRALQSFRL